jgi:hypothetical protein
VVEQDERTKHYRLSIEFFVLAARAGNPSHLRDLCRPLLLRLSASLGDTLFLLARSGFDAVCIDRSEGPFPIRSFTGDIGGRVALGVGQGSLAILAFLPEAEREEVIRFNVPRVRELGALDEVYLRTEIDRVRVQGKQQPVAIYEVLAESGQLTPAQQALCSGFADALSAFRQQQFPNAHALAKFPGTGGPSPGAGKVPAERDSFYTVLRTFDDAPATATAGA